METKPWHSRKKQCHKCDKETKLAFKCEHCGNMQQWDNSDQIFFFKSLSILEQLEKKIDTEKKQNINTLIS